MSRGLRGRNDPPVTLFAFQDVMTSIIGILLFVVILMAIQTSVVAQAIGDVSHDGSLSEQIMELEKRRDAAIKALEEQARIAERARDSGGMRGILEDRSELSELYRRIEQIDAEIARRFDQMKRVTETSTEATSPLGQMIAAQQENERLKGELDESRLNKRLTYIISKDFGKSPILVELSKSVWRVSADANGDTMISVTDDSITDRLESLIALISNFSNDDFYCLLIIKPSQAEQVETVMERLSKEGFQIGLDAIPEDFSSMIESSAGTP